LEANTPCFLSSSILSLLAVINAISIPLEKADASNDKKIIRGQYESIQFSAEQGIVNPELANDVSANVVN